MGCYFDVHLREEDDMELWYNCLGFKQKVAEARNLVKITQNSNITIKSKALKNLISTLADA